jgi:hypothetical protein
MGETYTNPTVIEDSAASAKLQLKQNKKTETTIVFRMIILLDGLEKGQKRNISRTGFFI